MKICMIGTGYVGLVSGTCFADLGNKVYCVDKDKSKINKLKNAISPIYEPGLEDFLEVKKLAKSKFKKVQFFKPEASRNESKETYLHCSLLKTL